MNERPVILLGAGGHAKVVLDLLLALDRQVVGVCDPELAANGATTWRELDVLGADDAVSRYAADSIELANGIGSMPSSSMRRRLHEGFLKQGYRFANLIHPTAILGSGIVFGQGVQVMAGAIVQVDTYVGDNVIINTGARIDHDGYIGHHVHLAPGVVLSGGVTIEDEAHIGPGAIVIQRVKVNKGAVVGAGTTVLNDIPAYHQQTGQPPREPHVFSEKNRT